MPEATFDSFYGSELNRMGWEPEYGIDGQITGYWRPTALDTTRGANQKNVLQGSDYGFEYVPADKINGGQPAAEDLEYRTGGTSLNQTHPSKWVTVGVPLAIAAMAAGAGGQAAGLWNLGGAAAEGAGGLLGSTGLSGTLGGPTAGLLNSEAMFLGASPEVLAAAGIDPALTSAAMGGAAGIGAGGPTMGSALTGALGATGAGLTNAALAGASGIGTSLLNAGGLANATWPQTSIPSVDTPPAPPTDTAPPVDNSPQTRTVTTPAPGSALSNLPDWLKALLPLAGGALAAYDAKNQPDMLGDPVSRDFLRGHMTTDPLARLRPSYGLLAGYGQPTAQQGGLVNNQLFNSTGLRG